MNKKRTYKRKCKSRKRIYKSRKRIYKSRKRSYKSRKRIYKSRKRSYKGGYPTAATSTSGHILDVIRNGRLLEDMLTMFANPDLTTMKLFLGVLSTGIVSPHEGVVPFYFIESFEHSIMPDITRSGMVRETYEQQILDIKKGTPSRIPMVVLSYTGLTLTGSETAQEYLNNDPLIKHTADFLHKNTEISKEYVDSATYDGEMGDCSAVAFTCLAYISTIGKLKELLTFTSVYDNPWIVSPSITNILPYGDIVTEIKKVDSIIQSSNRVFVMYCGAAIEKLDSHFFTITLSANKAYIYSKLARDRNLYEDHGVIGCKQIDVDKLIKFLIALYSSKFFEEPELVTYYLDLVRGNPVYGSQRVMKCESIAIYEVV